MMDAPAQYGYLGLFLASFLAATILPFGSEIASAISACNTVHLLFDRARIHIDKNVQQTKILSLTPGLVRVPPIGGNNPPGPEPLRKNHRPEFPGRVD